MAIFDDGLSHLGEKHWQKMGGRVRLGSIPAHLANSNLTQGKQERYYLEALAIGAKMASCQAKYREVLRISEKTGKLHVFSCSHHAYCLVVFESWRCFEFKLTLRYTRSSLGLIALALQFLAAALDRQARAPQILFLAVSAASSG